MRKPVKSNTEGVENKRPRSADVAARGVKTTGDFGNLLFAVIGDVLDGSISPGVANAALSGASKIIRVAELHRKYGGQASDCPLQLAAVPTVKGKRAEIEAAKLEAELRRRGG